MFGVWLTVLHGDVSVLASMMASFLAIRDLLMDAGSDGIRVDTILSVNFCKPRGRFGKRPSSSVGGCLASSAIRLATP